MQKVFFLLCAIILMVTAFCYFFLFNEPSSQVSSSNQSVVKKAELERSFQQILDRAKGNDDVKKD